jgi:hypothetical protein
MISQVFRRHPELSPSGKVTILGRPRCSAERMSAYAARRNPQAPPVARMYLEKAGRYGIRGDVAFCQAMHDSRTWTSAPPGPPWQPFTHTIWGAADPDWTADELERRTEIHLQQLFTLVSDDRRNVTCWEELNGKWVIPGRRYGQDIVAIWRNMMEWKGEGEWVTDAGENSRTRTDVESSEAAGTDGDYLEWLAGKGWLPTPAPHPARQVTWAELARVLRSWEQGIK